VYFLLKRLGLQSLVCSELGQHGFLISFLKWQLAGSGLVKLTGSQPQIVQHDWNLAHFSALIHVNFAGSSETYEGNTPASSSTEFPLSCEAWADQTNSHVVPGRSRPSLLG
jgi:hypothetical protein